MLTTTRQLLDNATAQLTAGGVPNPRVDAEWLLAHALGVRRDRLWTAQERAVPAAERATFEQLLARRCTREPLQYILGTQEFYGREFRVTPDVLIPRPETELLAATALRCLTGDGRRATGDCILEIGSGSGCIAITLACECPTARIVATDVSDAAIAVAKENARAHGVVDRIAFHHEDVTHDAPRTTHDGRFDLLISNPPYCPADQWAQLPPEVGGYEPRQALCAGPEGLDFLRAIIQDAPAMLKPNGWLCLEIGDGQAGAVRQLMRKTGALTNVQTRTDYNEIERIVAAQHG